MARWAVAVLVPSLFVMECRISACRGRHASGPLAALPYCNVRQTMHPAWGMFVAVLRSAGVTVLLGDGGFTPHEPGQGLRDAYPWDAGIDAISAKVS